MKSFCFSLVTQNVQYTYINLSHSKEMIIMKNGINQSGHNTQYMPWITLK